MITLSHGGTKMNGEVKTLGLKPLPPVERHQKDIPEMGGLAAGRGSQDNKFKRKDQLVFNLQKIETRKDKKNERGKKYRSTGT
jgi:hypothetical protein